MFKYLLSLALIGLFCLESTSQNANENGHFLVEFDKFSPPVKDMIAAFEGKSLIPFMASDLDGKEHFNGNYKGKTLVLFFWKKDCYTCLDQLQTMNSLKEDFPASEFQIISFYDEEKASARNYVQDYSVQFPVIANAQILSEGAYGSELGYPRVFIINDRGITKKVIPEEAFMNSTSPYLMIKDHLEKVVK